ncbi:MAG: DUF1080 domain-containing protein [Verrucomicrobia bacterium]|nr:MAG: DUF1080 domain-containing protein [Verrucomicrobiota bacterium]
MRHRKNLLLSSPHIFACMTSSSHMKTFFALFLSTIATLCAQPDASYKPLFNGKDLSGWKVVNGKGQYHIEGDCIVGTGKNVNSNTFLRTEKVYRDFDFYFEMKFDDLSGNSGMMFRGLQKPGADGRVHGYQCEHDNRKDRVWTAGLYDEARRNWLSPPQVDAKNTDAQKAEQAAFTAAGKKLFRWNDWNQIRIRCQGKHIQIWLNGEKRVDYLDEAPQFTPEGFFALQVHSGRSCHVRWRNLLIKEL